MRSADAGLNDAARAIAAVLIALIAGALIVPAMNLSATGLWTDELFTDYFSDPALSWSAALFRAAEDVHPPAYALLIGLLRRITGGDTEIVARGFALACSAATLAVLAAALRRRMGKLALLFTLATAALSGSFLSVVAEARSYALAELLATAEIALILRLLPPAGEPRGRLPLAALLILGGLVHSYLALVGVALGAYLVLTAEDARARAGWALVALLAAATAAAVARWQAPYLVPDPARTWFSAALRDQAMYIARGGLLAVGSPLGIAALLLAIRTVPWRQARAGLADPIAMLRTPAGLALFAIAATVAAAVGYTSLILPVLSRRLFLVIAPFFWLLAGELFRVALHRPRRLVPALLLVAAAIGASRIPDAGQQQVEPWRDSARAIAALPGCAGAPIVVSGFDQPFVRGSEAAAFYGRYLASPPPRLEAIPRDASAAIFADRALRAHGASGCPVLLWSVHHLRKRKVLEIADILRRDPRTHGRGIAVESFAVARPVALLPHFRRRTAADRAFIVRLADPAR